MMRLVTTVVALMLVILAMLAAHHAQTIQEQNGHAVVAELDATHQSVAAPGGIGPASVGVEAEQVMIGLATGCLVLIACCALGLALLASRTWRAQLAIGLNSMMRALRIGDFGGRFGAFAGDSRPSLVALSISRT